MRLSQLMGKTDVEMLDDREVTGITCDSKQVHPGWAFVCIKGTHDDGHRHVREAIHNGAVAVICERDCSVPEQVLVPSTVKAWPQMCANWFGRPAEKLHLIGITGTNGKTSVSYMLREILQSCKQHVGLVGTVQNDIGGRILSATHTTPDPYDLQSMLALMVAEGCQYAVMEVSSHALAQYRVDGCHFDVGVFTNLTQDHLDYHKTMPNYLAAKRRLFTMCDTAVVNLDSRWTPSLLAGMTCKVVSFSCGDDTADYTARNIRPKDGGVDFEFVGYGMIGRVKLGIPGIFSVYNAMAAASVAVELGMPLEQVLDALSHMPGVPGRAEVVPTGRPFSVIIDYAHTPDGLENICRTLRDSCHANLITVFGCGGDRDKDKRPRMAKAAAAYSDFLVITSDNPRTEDPMDIIEDILPGLEKSHVPYVVEENRVKAIEYALSKAREGDMILLAGKGHETYQILKTGVIELDERKVVREALKKLPE